MTKEDQFLFLVQTAVLTNGINLVSLGEVSSQDRVNISATGVMGMMLDAIWASERIPAKMTAHTAAVEFCSFMLDNLRAIEEAASGMRMSVPHWFARH